MRGSANQLWVDIIIVLMYVVEIACIAVILLTGCMILKFICATLLFAVPWCCAIITLRLNRLKDKGDI